MLDRFFKSSASKIITTVIVTLIVILLLIGTWFLSAWINRPTEEKDTYSIREQITEVAQLTTYDYNFTQILYYSSKNTNTPFSIEIPFSENKYIATIDGTASVYTNLDLVSFEPTYSLSGLLISVDITLPHAEIKQPIALDFSTLNVLEDRNGFLNDISNQQKNDLLVETYATQTEKIKSSGLLEKADQRVQELISTQLQNTYGKNVQVNFKFIDNQES